MIATRARRAAVATFALVLLAPGDPVASAAPAPQIVDPTGDSLAGESSADIVSVTFATIGVGKGRRYVPKKLVVTLVLAAAPRGLGAVGYNIRADTDGCGPIRIHFYPGTVSNRTSGDTSAHFGGCSQDGPLFFNARIDDNVISFGFGLTTVGIDRGTRFSEFTATVDANDVVVGLFGTQGPATAGLLDFASGPGSWVIP